MSCVICDKHKDTKLILFENDNWIITPGAFDSHIVGYLLLEPKRHIENWYEFNNNELEEMGTFISRVEQGLRSFLDIDRLYVLTISEEVRHLHFHLIPRSTNGGKKGIELIKQATQQKEINEFLSKEEFNEIIFKIRNSL
ncbi:HIT family protein [Alkalihalobacillus sp. FSL R5-0424]